MNRATRIVLEAVEDEYGFGVAELVSKRQSDCIGGARDVAAYLLKRQFARSYYEIAVQFSVTVKTAKNMVHRCESKMYRSDGHRRRINKVSMAVERAIVGRVKRLPEGWRVIRGGAA